MNEYKKKLRSGIKSLNSSLVLTDLLEKYYKNQTYREKVALEAGICMSNDSKLLLPSGRYGSPLALALEFNNYIAALYMIDNSEKLNLSLEDVSSDYYNQDIWNLEIAYQNSFLLFNYNRNDPRSFLNYNASKEIEAIIKNKKEKCLKKAN